MTIRWKISLLVLASVLATVLPASYMMFEQSSAQIRQLIDSQLANKLTYFEHIIHTNEAHTQRTTITIAQALEVRKALHLHSSLGLNALLNRNASTYPMFNYILIVDLNHEVFAATTRDKLQNRLPSEQILGDKVERYNKANLLNLGANSAPPRHDTIKALLGLNDDESQWFSAPVLKKGTPIGWVIVSYDWHSELNKTLRNSENKFQSLVTDIETNLTTVSNRVIAGKQPRGKKWSQPAGTLMKEKSILLGSKPFLLKVSVPESLIATPLRQSAEHIMFVTLGIIAVVLALLYILIEQVFLKRLIQLQEGAIAIKTGKLNHKIPNLGKDELGSLSTTFNEMSTSLYELNTQLEREVHSRTAELLRSNEELDNFAYVASHDLKAPLRAIDNLATWIQEDLDELANPETKEHLRLLQGRIYRMEKLLEDLLEYSRIGRKEEHVKAVDCEVLVQETFSLIASDDSFKLLISSLPKFETIKVAFEQILRNLFSNAIKHHHKTTGTIKVECIEGLHFYEFFITDDGPGIDPQFHEKVFGMFQTLRSRDEVEGSGMGLALIKKTVEVYGGAIQIDSEEGKGTQISFTWPKLWNQPTYSKHKIETKNVAAVSAL